jgi:DNA-directed RNA polymerase III subunit RPC4
LGGVARAKFAPKLPANAARRFTPVVLNSDRTPSPLTSSPTSSSSPREFKPIIKGEDRQFRKDRPAKVTFTAADSSSSYTYTARESSEVLPNSSTIDIDSDATISAPSNDDWTNNPLMPISIPFPHRQKDSQLTALSDAFEDMKVKRDSEWKFGAFMDDLDDYTNPLLSSLSADESKESEPLPSSDSPLHNLQWIDSEEKRTRAPSKQLMFFQLPTHLPWKPSSVAPNPSSSTSSSSSSTQSSSSSFSLRTNHIFHPSFEHALRNVPQGRIGSLLIMKSGKVKMKIGDCYYEVQNGADLIGHQEVLSVNVKEKKNSDSTSATSSSSFTSSSTPLTSPILTSTPSEELDRKERVFDRQDAIQLGRIMYRFVCSVDVNTTLKQIETGAAKNEYI